MLFRSNVFGKEQLFHRRFVGVKFIDQGVDALFEHAQPHGEVFVLGRFHDAVIDGGTVSVFIFFHDAVAHRPDAGVDPQNDHTDIVILFRSDVKKKRSAVDFSAIMTIINGMQELYTRTAMLIGYDAVEKLKLSHVAVFGLGGVGGYCAEALARAGVGALDLIDGDAIAPSNLNRQILATRETIGQSKAAVCAERMRLINPALSVTPRTLFFDERTADELDFHAFDYVVDAIDTVSGKIELILRAKKANVPVISCMGTGNKLDATAFRVADLSKTKVCPLARVMRRELNKRGVERLKVVYSEEPPRKPLFSQESETRRQTPASISFVPSVAGLILAGEVIKDLIGQT